MDDIDFIDVIECVTARLETAVVEWVTEDDLGQIVEVITIVAESQVVETQLIYYEWGGGGQVWEGGSVWSGIIVWWTWAVSFLFFLFFILIFIIRFIVDCCVVTGVRGTV